MTRPRILLVPSFTELEWGIRPELEGWAEVATFDPPGVGASELPAGFELDSDVDDREFLAVWREATAEHGWREVEKRGWASCVVVGDSHGSPTAVGLARSHPDVVIGLALGHATLSNATEGERAPMRGGVWEALIQLAHQGSEAVVRHGIAQMTRGGVSDRLAEQMIERFPDMDVVTRAMEALRDTTETIGDDLAALRIPLLLAKHDGCLGRTDEGFEDIVAAFPEARTAICPETCTASPAFAEALRLFCASLEFEARRR